LFSLSQLILYPYLYLTLRQMKETTEETERTSEEVFRDREYQVRLTICTLCLSVAPLAGARVWLCSCCVLPGVLSVC
jgi:hypothetical protein